MNKTKFYKDLNNRYLNAVVQSIHHLYVNRMQFDCSEFELETIEIIEGLSYRIERWSNLQVCQYHLFYLLFESDCRNQFTSSISEMKCIDFYLLKLFYYVSKKTD